MLRGQRGGGRCPARAVHAGRQPQDQAVPACADRDQRAGGSSSYPVHTETRPLSGGAVRLSRRDRGGGRDARRGATGLAARGGAAVGARGYRGVQQVGPDRRVAVGQGRAGRCHYQPRRAALRAAPGCAACWRVARGPGCACAARWGGRGELAAGIFRAGCRQACACGQFFADPVAAARPCGLPGGCFAYPGALRCGRAADEGAGVLRR
ncbi:hypothetical protein D3C85_1240580 [compost metagenome]